VSFGLLKKYDVATPRGGVAKTPLEAEAIAESLGTPTRRAWLLAALLRHPVV